MDPFTHISQLEDISIIPDENKLTVNTNESSQHSFKKKNNHHHYDPKSARVQRSLISLTPVHSNQYQHDQEEVIHKKLNVMVMAPKKYEDMTIRKNLFQEFTILFKADVKELITQILDEEKYKKDSFELYKPRELSKCSGICLRIYEGGKDGSLGDHRFAIIKRPGVNQTLDELIKTGFDEFNPQRHNIYYHTYKLSADACSWHKECDGFNGQDILPTIFDLTVAENEQAPKTTARIVQIHSLEHRKFVTRSTTEGEQIPKTMLYQNYAHTVYIRLRLDAAIHCQLESGLHENQTKNEKISDMLSNFYLFCDKDKSAKLDEHEQSIGLLTLLKYIDDEENKLTADIRLPIVYDKEESSNTEHKSGFDEKDFRTLIIDTLTEHLRIRSFDYLHCSVEQSFNEVNEKIDRITDNIKKTLKKDLQRKAEEYEAPFSFTKILMHSGLFLMCLLFLPIVVFYTIICNLPKNTDSSKSKIIRILLVILFAIISTLLSSIIYLIIIEIILYHIYYKEYIQWHISALETYWPFALICCIVCIAYLYGSPFLVNSDYRKNKQLQQYYHEAELDILKHEAKVIVLKAGKFQYETMAKWELQSDNVLTEQAKSTKKKSYNHKKKNFWKKILQVFINIYQNEKKYSKKSVILLKIISLILILCISVIHACTPTIYRAYSTNYTYPTNTTKSVIIRLIEITFIIDDTIIYSIFLLMIMYAYHLYNILGIKLNRIMRQTANSNEYNVTPKNTCYLDLKNQVNLDLFLAQLRNVLDVNNSIEYQLALATVGAAFILVLILGLVVIFRLVQYGVGSLITLTGSFILIDIVMLSMLIIGFLINVAIINTTATVKVQELLLRTKKEILSDKSDRTILKKHKNEDVTYLTAMAEQLDINKKLYSITIFGFIVDNALVSKVFVTLLTEAAVAAAALVKTDLSND